MFDERIPALASIADREDTASADRIRALDLLAKVGLGGETYSIEEIRASDSSLRRRSSTSISVPVLRHRWRSCGRCSGTTRAGEPVVVSSRYQT